MPRYIWLVTGHTFFIVGVIGVFVPLLPTTPFLLLAGVCYSRGSDRFESWLLNHKIFGPPVRDWRLRGVIRRRAKILASIVIFSSILFVWLMPAILTWAKITMTLVVTSVLAFIYSRPSS